MRKHLRDLARLEALAHESDARARLGGGIALEEMTVKGGVCSWIA